MIVTRYKIAGPVNLKLAVVADMHEHDPREVLRLLRANVPDVIVIPGDILERRSKADYIAEKVKKPWEWVLYHLIYWMKEMGDAHGRHHGTSKENGYRLLRGAAKIAPVVYSRGNHDLNLTEEDRELLKKTGVHLLDDEYMELLGVKFGGLGSKSFSGAFNMGFVQDFAHQKGYKILLSHHPEDYPAMADLPIDLILSGHCHGGQIRLLGHGVYSPGQGIFPKYHHGIYHEGKYRGRMIVSAGCARTNSFPRWGNPPELVIVEIKKM